MVLDFMGEPICEPQVTTKEGIEIAEKINAVFFETSAKTDICVKDAFESCVSLFMDRWIRRVSFSEPPQPRRSNKCRECCRSCVIL